MAWQTPKTDWASSFDSDGAYTGDYFNATDYQRIKGNLEYLRDYANQIYSDVVIEDIPDITVASFATVSSINALENSLTDLVNGSFDPGIPARKTWYANGKAPAAADLNRIEGACLTIYNSLYATYAAVPRLAMTLGGVQF